MAGYSGHAWKWAVAGTSGPGVKEADKEGRMFGRFGQAFAVLSLRPHCGRLQWEVIHFLMTCEGVAFRTQLVVAIPG